MIRRQWTCDRDPSTRRGALKLPLPWQTSLLIIHLPWRPDWRGKTFLGPGFLMTSSPWGQRGTEGFARADEIPGRRDSQCQEGQTKRFLLARSGEEGGPPRSVATWRGHTPARSLPAVAGFAERGQTPLLRREGHQLASGHTHSFPLGLPGAIRTDRGLFATVPCFSRSGQGCRFLGPITGPCKLLLPNQLGSAPFITIQQSFQAGSPRSARGECWQQPLSSR